MWLGANSRCELAKQAQALGYELRVTHADGRFALAHVGIERHQVIGRDCAALTSAGRIATLIVAGSNQNPKVFNRNVRNVREVHEVLRRAGQVQVLPPSASRTSSKRRRCAP
jgi:hypothetical protein